jgi:hypothetical protein
MNGGKFDGGQLTNQEKLRDFTNDFLILQSKSSIDE